MPAELHPLQLRDGTHSLLGQRKSVLVAHPIGVGAQGAALRVAASALRQARTSIAADVEAQSARSCAGVEGRRLRGVRIRGDSLLPRTEVSAEADFRVQPRGGGLYHARDLRIPGL